MNALVGQEDKFIRTLFLLVCGMRADDGCRKDGGDFSSAGCGRHLCRGHKFEVLHDGSGE